jgi:hypothetical protein
MTEAGTLGVEKGARVMKGQGKAWVMRLLRRKATSRTGKMEILSRISLG